MPQVACEVQWDDEEETIIRQTYKHGWERAAVLYGIQETLRLAKEKPHDIHVIVDFRLAPLDTPAKLTVLSSNIENSVPPNQKYLYIIGANRYIRLMMQYASMLAPRASRNREFVESLEDAYVSLRGKGVSFTVRQSSQEPER